MRHSKGQASVNCLDLSKHTQSQCEEWVCFGPNLSPLTTLIYIMLIIVDTEFQSQSYVATPPSIGRVKLL